MKIKYFFRNPAFPILIINGKDIFGAYSVAELQNIISKNDFSKEKYYKIIDSTKEGWAYYPEQCVISPITSKKYYFKKELIELFNNSNQIQRNNLKTISERIQYKNFSDILEMIIDRLHN